MNVVDDMSRRGFDPLTYKFEDQEPAPGGVTEVADGVIDSEVDKISVRH